MDHRSPRAHAASVPQTPVFKPRLSGSQERFTMPSLAPYSLSEGSKITPSAAPMSDTRTSSQSASGAVGPTDRAQRLSSAQAIATPGDSTNGAAGTSKQAQQAKPAPPSLRNIYSAVPRTSNQPSMTQQRKRGNTFSLSSSSRTQPLPQSRRSSFHNTLDAPPDLSQLLGDRFLRPVMQPHMGRPAYIPAPEGIEPSSSASTSTSATINGQSSRTPSRSNSPDTEPRTPPLPRTPPDLAPPPWNGAQQSEDMCNIFHRIETITRPVELTIQTLLFRTFRALQVEFLRYPPTTQVPAHMPQPATPQPPQTATSGYMCLLLLGHIPPQNVYDAAWLHRVQSRLHAVYANPQLLAHDGGECSVRDVHDLLLMLGVLVSCIRRISDVMVRSGVLRSGEGPSVDEQPHKRRKVSPEPEPNVVFGQTQVS